MRKRVQQVCGFQQTLKHVAHVIDAFCIIRKLLIILRPHNRSTHPILESLCDLFARRPERSFPERFWADKGTLSYSLIRRTFALTEALYPCQLGKLFNRERIESDNSDIMSVNSLEILKLRASWGMT